MMSIALKSLQVDRVLNTNILTALLVYEMDGAIVYVH